MNLKFIHDQVRRSVARGNALDAEIPDFVASAARWIERNHNLKHMERFGELSVSHTASDPRFIELPNERVKSLRFLRSVQQGQDGCRTLHRIPRVDPSSPDRHQAEGPIAGYWQSAEHFIVLSDTPEEVLELELGWYEYTAWPTDPLASNWLIENGSDALIAQALTFMAPRLRDAQLLSLYAKQREEGISTMLRAYDEGEYSDTDAVMEYKPYAW